jgi:hypothetical protein
LAILTPFTGVVLVAGYSLAAWIGFASYSTNLAFQWVFPELLPPVFVVKGTY